MAVVQAKPGAATPATAPATIASGASAASTTLPPP
jgi:hypothetical protein